MAHDVARSEHRAQVRDFLSSRRARITPEQAGLPAYGGHRRVTGLRREEVALLAGMSVDYYVRMERGDLSGASDGVLDALATSLQFDEAEREHLFALARAAGPASWPAAVAARLPPRCAARSSRSSMRSPTLRPGCATAATTSWR